MAVHVFTKVLSLGGAAHAEANLHKWLEKLFGNPIEPYNIWMDLDCPHDIGRQASGVPTLPLWEVLHAIWLAGDLQFNVSLLGEKGESAIAEFWNHCKDLDWAKSHPAVQNSTADERSRLIPLYVHCDGAVIYRDAEFYVWSVSSALSMSTGIDIMVFRTPRPTHSHTSPTGPRDRSPGRGRSNAEQTRGLFGPYLLRPALDGTHEVRAGHSSSFLRVWPALI